MNAGVRLILPITEPEPPSMDDLLVITRALYVAVDEASPRSVAPTTADMLAAIRELGELAAAGTQDAVRRLEGGA